MHDYLAIRSFVAGVSQTRNFHSACNFDIVKLNDKTLPESEQNLKFLEQVKKHFSDKKRLVKFRLAPY